MKQHVLLADCHDSFVYNLVEQVRQLGAEADIRFIEQLSPSDLTGYDALILSPGPGTVREFPQLFPLIEAALSLNLPTLGVCLGHQAIAKYFGAELEQITHPLHGHSDLLAPLASCPLISALPSPQTVGRYHSWAVKAKTLPPEIIPTTQAKSDGALMSLRHSERPLFGVQFHPESYITIGGDRLLATLLAIKQ